MISVDPIILEKTVRQACANILAAEPNLTKFDTISGDGDCGTNLEAGARGLLAALDGGVAKNGSILAVVHAFVHITVSLTKSRFFN